jgi:hypothetical protein
MEQRSNFACHAHHNLADLGATNAGYMNRNCRRSCNLCGGGGGGGGRQISAHEIYIVSAIGFLCAFEQATAQLYF